ncbi:hypothetical protein NKV53_11070 [Legionella sp. 27cVA30]|uniref:hypothetical protein n=1 Tax=Legionella sp. 27cVA30 TaxID=2905657 RepID=UPI00209CF534|nr:hypothetical protein [Legionella sp. 27cVA30]MCP0914867.1 hypothetical protein [Legionella sp. 27cVA30]
MSIIMVLAVHNIIAMPKTYLDQHAYMDSWLQEQFSFFTKSNHVVADEGLKEKYQYCEWVLEKDNAEPALKIRSFATDSYNGPRLEDFLDRLEAVSKTAATIIEQSQLPNEDKEKRLSAIDAYKAKAERGLKKHCGIPAIALAEIGNSETEEKVIQQINEAGKHLRFFLAHALPIVYPEEKRKAALQLFQNEEAKWTAAQGRPNFINQYDLGGDVTRISAQRVVGPSIIPSTKRDEGKLANFVEVAIGSKGNQGNELDFTGFRHSSYPPIKEKDKIKRRAMACEAVKDMFRELARKSMERGRTYSEASPLEINLSSMGLLSPIMGDKRIMKAEESELRQLKESQYALMMYNQRPLELEIDGQKIVVKPNVNLMNDPANLHGLLVKQTSQKVMKFLSKFHLPIPASLDETINTRGIYHFVKDGREHIANELRDLDAVDKAAEDIIRIYRGIPHASKQLRKAEKNLEELLKKGDLAASYQELENRQQAYLKDSTPFNEKKYYEQVDKIRSLEGRMQQAYKKVVDERAKLYEKNKESYAALEKKIVAYLSDPENQEKLQGQDGEKLRKLLQFMQLFQQSEALYYGGNTEPHEFPARYLILNQMMGTAVDWFCKSGEDRTGREQNFIEELYAFLSLHKHFPQFDFKQQGILQKDRALQQELAKTVVEFSVSRDICGENAHGARGLQQTDSGMEVNKGLPNASGYALAKLAKSNLYNEKKLKQIKTVPLEAVEQENAQIQKSQQAAYAEEIPFTALPIEEEQDIDAVPPEEVVSIEITDELALDDLKHISQELDAAAQDILQAFGSTQAKKSKKKYDGLPEQIHEKVKTIQAQIHAATAGAKGNLSAFKENFIVTLGEAFEEIQQLKQQLDKKTEDKQKKSVLDKNVQILQANTQDAAAIIHDSLNQKTAIIKEENLLRSGESGKLHEQVANLHKAFVEKHTLSGVSVRKRYAQAVNDIQESINSLEQLHGQLKEGVQTTPERLLARALQLEAAAMKALQKLAEQTHDEKKQAVFTKASNIIMPALTRAVKEIELREWKDERVRVEQEIKTSLHDKDAKIILREPPLQEKTVQEMTKFLRQFAEKNPNAAATINIILSGLQKDFEKMQILTQTGLPPKDVEALSLGINMYTQSLSMLGRWAENKEETRQLNQTIPGFVREITQAVTALEKGILEHEIQGYKDYAEAQKVEMQKQQETQPLPVEAEEVVVQPMLEETNPVAMQEENKATSLYDALQEPVVENPSTPNLKSAPPFNEAEIVAVVDEKTQQEDEVAGSENLQHGFSAIQEETQPQHVPYVEEPNQFAKEKEQVEIGNLAKESSPQQFQPSPVLETVNTQEVNEEQEEFVIPVAALNDEDAKDEEVSEEIVASQEAIAENEVRAEENSNPHVEKTRFNEEQLQEMAGLLQKLKSISEDYQQSLEEIKKPTEVQAHNKSLVKNLMEILNDPAGSPDKKLEKFYGKLLEGPMPEFKNLKNAATNMDALCADKSRATAKIALGLLVVAATLVSTGVFGAAILYLLDKHAPGISPLNLLRPNEQNKFVKNLLNTNDAVLQNIDSAQETINRFKAELPKPCGEGNDNAEERSIKPGNSG